MNIFVLDKDPKIAASYHCDSHVNKMILESCQMLGSVFYILQGISTVKDSNKLNKNIVFKDLPKFDKNNNWKPFGPGYLNHPCTIWVSQSLNNYKYLISLVKELCVIYKNKSNKSHSWESIVTWFENNIPKFKNTELTDFVMAMPKSLQSKDVVKSYQLFYALKTVIHKIPVRFTKNEKPYWLTESLIFESIDIAIKNKEPLLDKIVTQNIQEHLYNIYYKRYSVTQKASIF